MNTPSQKLIGALLDRFETSQIMIFLFGLWAIYAIAPEPIPFIDDIILGILTLQAARWASKEKSKKPPAKAQDPSGKPPMKNVTPPKKAEKAEKAEKKAEEASDAP